MATLDPAPMKELSDSELRKRLLAVGYDVPVSVNRDFLIKKLESVYAGGSQKGKRQSMGAPTSNATPSPSTVRKRKSIAVTPSNSNASGRLNHHNSINSPPMSPLATSLPGTPQSPYSSNSSISIATPSTPSPFVSRLSTPSTSGGSPVNNGESGSHNPSPRYMSYYNMFKTSPQLGGQTPTSGAGDGGFGYAYRSIRMSSGPNMNPVSSVAPPQRSSDRNGYASGSGGSMGVESDWCGGHLISKILVCGFILFFLVIGILYVRQNMTVDPKGLTASGGETASGEKIVVPPRPEKKKEAVGPPVPLSMIYPICGTKGTDPEACIPRDVVKNSRTLFNALKAELFQRARKRGCHTEIQDIISLQEAKTLLYKLSEMRKAEVDAAFSGMLLLVTENPRQGLRLTAESFGENEVASKDIAGLDMTLTKISAPDENPDFTCWIMSMITNVTWTIGLGAGAVGFSFGLWKVYGVYRRRKKSEEDEVFKFVERVLDLLQRQYELSESGQGPAFIAVNHVRDELVPSKERQKKEALWNKVLYHISNNESRVREEIQHISGEEFKVWRWLPSASPLSTKRFSTTANLYPRNRQSMPLSPMASSSSHNQFSPLTSTPNLGMAKQPVQNNLYPNLSNMSPLNGEDDDDMEGGPGSDPNSNNKWQGQAFETCEGSPNALPITPTTCLKIRHMFTDRDATLSDTARIEQEILGKCKDAKILHIGIDKASVEGCVYIRCLTKEDARKAFMSLHGWWFDGHLLSVKFLREERYFSRFPEAKNCSHPLAPVSR